MKEILDSFAGPEPLFVALRMALILAATLGAGAFVRKFLRRRIVASIHKRFLLSILAVAAYFVGIMLALAQIPSFNRGVEAIITGSGIAALILGLAAQESLGNLFNGMFISLFKPFEVNDRIHLVNAGITGVVEDITLRHTVIRTFLNSRLIVPNSAINKDIIENSHFGEKKASSFVDATITYESDLERACAIMGDCARESPLTIGEDAPKVYIRGFSEFGVDLRISVWAKDVNANFDACSDIRMEIKRRFDAEGIRFGSLHEAAFPAALSVQATRQGKADC
jgi:small-conductance mechanosensitive channel